MLWLLFVSVTDYYYYFTFLRSQGDRMWTFAVSLLLVGLYPGSLLMPGVLGFLVQFFVAIFGTIVGDYVDANSRRKSETGWIVC